MNKKIIFLVIVSMLFVNASFGISVDNLKSINNDVDIPTWSTGNSWKYYMSISGGYESNIIELEFQDITFTVEQVQTEFYNMDVTGTFTGYASLRLPFLPFQVTGSISDGQISATSNVSKNTLLLSKMDNVQILGKIGRYDFNAYGQIVFTYATPGALHFPLNIGDIWYPGITLIYPDLKVNVLGLNLNIPNILNSTYNAQKISIWAHTVEVDCWDLIEIGTSDYDALKIVSPDLGEEKHEYWYAPSVGNIIKVKSRGIHVSGEPEGYFGQYDLDIELKETTYDIKTNPPSTPADFSGDFQILVGIEAFYTATATDPDYDMIRYICDWGDGTLSASETFYNSGLKGEISHIWTKKGEYAVKVKARDKSGAESSWSAPITVTVTNNAPEKPETPDGPTQGKIRTESYIYTTSTMDVDGHDLYYQFDWGDGITSGWIGSYKSGETASGSHTWKKSGSYSIKVKAMDEYYEESVWSDPLSVSMPKTYICNPIIQLILKKLEVFPFFEKILKI